MARKKLDKGVTLIASHTEVVGDIQFEDQLYVSGHINGNVLADKEQATVIISEDGVVVGEVHAPNIVINGRVEGNVYASQKVELAAQARVHGNLYYNLIEMQLGARVDGQLVHEIESRDDNVHLIHAEQDDSPGEA